VNYLFPPSAPKSIAVLGEALRFPVNRIFCVGRNYADHAKEMGVEVDREAPFYFTKTPSALEASGQTLPYPPGTKNFHYEMELVIAIGSPAFKMAKENALGAVFGYACGLDMTRRDLQLEARAKQRPWDLGKDVEQSAVVSTITRAKNFPISDQMISLAVNGATKQDAKLSDLVWSVEELVSHLSHYYHLVPGDIIFTGTPAGVGPVIPGDNIEGTIAGLSPVTLTIRAAE
jgi:fumarylpyruvate hydrolase